jgi:predicted dehydrogenase
VRLSIRAFADDDTGRGISMEPARSIASDSLETDSATVSRRLFMGAAGLSLITAAGVAAAHTALPDRAVGRPDPSLGSPPPLPFDRQLGFAVVGLGKLALGEVLDAFAAARRAKLVALVSGNPDKARKVAARYGVPDDAIYDYENFDRIAGDPRIDVVYIILPNALHKEFALRAFKAGKHVLCEKPMATNVADCEAMIEAAAAVRRKLMVAYRCQFEPHSLTAMRIMRRGELGDVRLLVANAGRPSSLSDSADQWRLNKALAGSGSLFDIGIYGLNGVRYLTNQEPVEVRAQLYAPPNDPRFREVEDVVAYQMRMPSGAIVNGSTSYSYAYTSRIEAIGTKGRLVLDPQLDYHAQKLTLYSGGERVIQYSPIDQFAREMDHFCEAITDNVPIVADGAEGMHDVRLMLAILEAGRTGRTISTDWGYRRAADPATTVKDGQGIA